MESQLQVAHGSMMFPLCGDLKNLAANSAGSYHNLDDPEAKAMVLKTYRLPKTVSAADRDRLGPEKLYKYLTRGISHKRTERKEVAYSAYIMSNQKRTGNGRIAFKGGKPTVIVTPAVVVPRLVNDAFAKTTTAKSHMNAAIEAVEDSMPEELQIVWSVGPTTDDLLLNMRGLGNHDPSIQEKADKAHAMVM